MLVRTSGLADAPFSKTTQRVLGLDPVGERIEDRLLLLIFGGRAAIVSGYEHFITPELPPYEDASPVVRW